MQKSLHNQTNELFSKVANICAKKYELEFNPTLPTLTKTKSNKPPTIIISSSKYEIVLPFPPTIYQMKAVYQEKLKKEAEEIVYQEKLKKEAEDNDHQELNKDKEVNKEVKKELFDVEKEICMERVAPSTDELSKVYRLMGFKILNIFALIILKKTQQKVERIVERVSFMNFIVYLYIYN